MLQPLQRLLLPCLQQVGVSTEWGTGISRHSGNGQQLCTSQSPGFLRCQLHTQPEQGAGALQPLPEVQQLTDELKQELKRVVSGSFKQDPKSASKLLAKSLSDEAKLQLLAALEAAQEPPGLSRTAMVDSRDNHVAHQAPAAAAGSAQAAQTEGSQPQEVQEPSFKQLLRVAITKGLPFVAFGFFDNIIMITAGEQIDLMFGAKLGLSSMAAAGLGNTVADVVGINISHTIEQKFKGMKSMAPALTKAQLALPTTQRAKWLGCAIGMASGCLLGLTPLLFYDASGAHGSCSSGTDPDAAGDSSSSNSNSSSPTVQCTTAVPH